MTGAPPRWIAGVDIGGTNLRVGNGSGRVTARSVCEAAAAGDAYAVRILTETARILAVAVANLINLLNPGAIVIAAGEHLFGPLGDEVRRRSFPSAVGACRIAPAQLPDTAGMIGAAGVFKRAAYGGV